MNLRFSVETKTNDLGNFSFKELPLRVPYTVKVLSSEYGKKQNRDYMLSLGDAIVVNFTMKEHEKTIEEVRIVGNIKNKINNFGRATSITPKDIAKLPVNGRNFANLTDLSPLSNGGNIMGQIGTATNFTIDGMTAKNPTSAGPTTYRSGAT